MATRSLPDPDQIRSYLQPFDFFERYVNGAQEGRMYVETHAARFAATLAVLADLPPGARVLELGAVPYYMTILLGRHLGAHVDPLSFYEVQRAHAAEHIVTSRATGERFTFPYRPINVERDAFPPHAEPYDLVTCCEILEHLLINPSQMLYQSHLALRPGGWLLVTTPNVARWENIVALQAGRNIYDRYHGNGVYGRHNREYTLDEVTALVEACGFTVLRAETRDVLSPNAEGRPVPRPGHEDTIFVLATATRPARVACPDRLYVLMDEYRHAVASSVRMGENDIGHVGAGWHDVEFEDSGASRWSTGEAEFALRRGEATTLHLDASCHHPDLAEHPLEVTVEVNGVSAGSATLRSYGWQDLAFHLPGPPSAELDCTIRVARTWTPSATGGQDGRQLGIRVRTIEVR